MPSFRNETTSPSKAPRITAATATGDFHGLGLPPTMKFPLDPSSEAGSRETETAHHLSMAQAKRSDRMGHDASDSKDLDVSTYAPARGVTLAFAKTAGATRRTSRETQYQSPRLPTPHREAIPLHPTPTSRGTPDTTASSAVSVLRNLKLSRDRLQRQHIYPSLSQPRFATFQAEELNSSPAPYS